MATRIVEGKKPYTGGKAISIDENKVISLNLRDENNLIIYDEGDDEIYVDLQLPDGITPTDAFPVGVTTGRAVVADGWDKAGTIICAKTTSGDNIKLLYADDGTLWIDNGTGTFKEIPLGGSAGADIEYVTQVEYDALPSSKLTDGKHYVIYTADSPTPPSPGWQPGANTLVYYNIDDNDTTTTIYDKSGNNYDATWSGTGIYVVDSDAGRVAYFNGLYADTGAVIDFGNNFTFNVWINQTVAPTGYKYQTIFGEGASPSTLPSVGLDFRNGSTKLFGFADGTGSGIILNVSTTADLNTWMLFSMVLDNGTLTIYKNGVSLGDLTNVPNPTYNISGGATFALSRWRNGDLNVFSGYIKEFIGENKSRTPQEIADYYDQTKSLYGIS